MSTTPRRPLVPGPPTTPISQRAIAVREEGPPGTDGGLVTNGGQMLRRELRPYALPTTTVGKVAGAIASVMSQVGTIEKGGKNEYFGYSYARMEDLLHVITPLMGKAGLAIIQNEVAKEVLEGNRLAVTYEFSIFHASGEVWPEKPRHTGMCISRDRKGNWDDKAVAKCHTNARKYFLLALFQVPAGDFDDADASDAENANQRRERRPVPGPAPQGSVQAAADKAVETLKEVAEDTPHRIILGQGSGPDQWGGAFIRRIKAAQTSDEVKAWDSANDVILQKLSDEYPGVYDQIDSAVQQRLKELAPAPTSTIWADPGVAMNWVAEQLAQFRSMEAAEAFWNETVAPQEKNFEPPDWEILLQEFKRTEARINPPDDDPPEAA